MMSHLFCDAQDPVEKYVYGYVAVLTLTICRFTEIPYYLNFSSASKSRLQLLKMASSVKISHPVIAMAFPALIAHSSASSLIAQFVNSALCKLTFSPGIPNMA